VREGENLKLSVVLVSATFSFSFDSFGDFESVVLFSGAFVGVFEREVEVSVEGATELVIGFVESVEIATFCDDEVVVVL
jgi:hypothetical protein